MALWWNFLGIVAENQFTCQEVEFEGNISLLRFCHELFILSKQILAFLGKPCSRFFKAAWYLSRGETNWGKHFYLIFSTIVGHWTKTLGPFGGNFRQGCQNFNLDFKKTSPMKIVFCHCSPMNCWYWGENSQPFVVKTLKGFACCILRVQKSNDLGKKICPPTVFVIFGHSDKTFWPFGGNVSALLQKSNLRVKKLSLTEAVFLLLFSHELFILSKKVVDYLVKRCSRVFKAASYVSRGAMAWEKNFVLELFLLALDIQIKQFGLLVETSRHCCGKAIYVSRSWVWRKPFF